ncbi:MAG: serine/threonine protein kinase [Phycisphaerales bacterium]|nr:serine/threonine protein kinase [Phycisphaerales bacterium]
MTRDANGHPSGDSRRVRELFGRVIDLPREQWPAFLEAECADLRVRGEVERLLRHHNPAQDDFLEAPAATVRIAAVDTWANSLIGGRIGQYTLLRLIAAGGMGCVFEARQEHPARNVAVKILPPGISASGALARFRLEPELLARLQHPNIAQVFESGVEESDLGPLPYFAMELIRGAVSIVDFAKAAALDSRRRLEMFAKVCDAVHHGHQKGVIHRDLKPANILVGADGEPKVIDFGIARATDADVLVTTQQTHVGDLIGTVRYMSPEQCDGDSTKIDTRSDVYSLGVVLYELLTSQSPYETTGTTIYSAVRMIKDDAPRQPSAHVRSLRGDVDAIVLKALEKDPARRYGSAADLARDIRHHLAHETIEARPPGWNAALLNWLRRHPIATSTIASMLLLAFSLVGAGVNYWYLTSRPAQIQISQDCSTAQVVTAIGGPLRTWRGKPGSIRFAEFVDRPEALGGGPVAIIGAPVASTLTWAGSVGVFDLRKNETADPEFWRLRTEDIARDEIIRHRGRDDISLEPTAFGPVVGILADVFDDPPGSAAPELVCFFKHQDVTHGALCIYRLNGTLAYRIWIDADLEVLYWVPGPRVLVCHGFNGEVPTVDREVQDPSPTVWHPRVTFGIRPVLGTILGEYLVQEPSERENARAEVLPLWYLCALPLTADHPRALIATTRVFPPEDTRVRDRCVQVMELAAPIGENRPPGLQSTSVVWSIDAATGSVIRKESMGDLYRKYGRTPENPDGYFPPYDSWYLGELPPKKKRPPASAPASAPVP